MFTECSAQLIDGPFAWRLRYVKCIVEHVGCHSRGREVQAAFGANEKRSVWMSSRQGIMFERTQFLLSSATHQSIPTAGALTDMATPLGVMGTDTPTGHGPEKGQLPDAVRVS
jgi:hypothetical protein